MSNEKRIFHASSSLPVKYVVWVGLRIMHLNSLIQLPSVLALLQSMVQGSATDYHWRTISVGLNGLCVCSLLQKYSCRQSRRQSEQIVWNGTKIFEGLHINVGYNRAKGSPGGDFDIMLLQTTRWHKSLRWLILDAITGSKAMLSAMLYSALVWYNI